MKKWEAAEAEIFTKIMGMADLPGTLHQLFYTVQASSKSGFFTMETLTNCALFVLARLFFIMLRSIGRPFLQFWLVFALYEIGQASTLCVVASDWNENFTLHLICSTAVLMIGEISPIHSLLFNALLVTKHMVLWTLVGRSRGVEGEMTSLIPALWVLWILLYAQEHKRRLLIAKQKAEEEKEVEERRLKALLYAIPDGIIVLSETTHVLTYNPTILSQFDLLSTPNPELKLETLIGTLRYDSEYLGKDQISQAFQDDIAKIMSGEEGVVGSFKPILFQGKHLECRGCVTKWDDSKVLILTIRDTSNWAQMEKTAQRDSANKTALIRSVSHELRTPVNAIINLCEDLQTSTALGRKDREDVEVVSNASYFLLSMINDLLDYSRFLHEKFALVKTNFDLEQLIRSCGALIALQCKQKGVNFCARVDPLLPKFAYTDENRLKQVILNLLSNAVK